RALISRHLSRAPTAYRAGEADQPNRLSLHDLCGGRMAHDEGLEYAVGQAGGTENACHAFAGQHGLTGMFEYDGITGGERRPNGVDRRHVREIPGRHSHYDTDWFTTNKA